LIEAAKPVAEYVIDMELAVLPAKASLQEREAVARRLLPILLASESDLYRKDNLQRLAMRLHIAERDLLAWAQEQQTLAALKLPRFEPSPAPVLPDMPEPPDWPEAWLEGTRAQPVLTQGKGMARSAENALERDCLRLLLHQPELIYHVNRQFRELAEGDAGLLAGPFNDLCLDDFSRTEYRALASVLSEALEQDEYDAVSYLRGQLQDELLQELEDILVGDLALLRPRLKHGLSVDLTSVVEASQRAHGVGDPADEILTKALRLRKQRLLRQRQEIQFLQLDAQDGMTVRDDFHNLHISLNELRLAQQRIEIALLQNNRTKRP
jgi:hypothetical protein